MIKQFHGTCRYAVPLLALALLAPVTRSAAIELEGYTEPYQTIEVAADASGVIDEILIRESEQVDAGQPLARLNSDIHRSLLAIAEQNMLAQGELDAAQADLELKQLRLDKLIPLRREGHARQEEVDRARSEVAVAEANVRSAREANLTRKLEYKKIETQITRRTIRAPISGVVTVVHKDQGEFVSPASPDVLTLVRLDPLLANFTMMSPEAATLEEGQPVEVRFLANDLTANGVIDFIAPVTDAESGTVNVKVHVDNRDGQFRSGERCRISLSE